MKKKIIVFILLINLCLIATGCGANIVGKWSVDEYIVTYGQQEYNYTIADADVIEYCYNDNLTEKQLVENYVLQFHSIYKMIIFNLNKDNTVDVFSQNDIAENVYSWSKTDNIVTMIQNDREEATYTFTYVDNSLIMVFEDDDITVQLVFVKQ